MAWATSASSIGQALGANSPVGKALGSQSPIGADLRATPSPVAQQPQAQPGQQPLQFPQYPPDTAPGSQPPPQAAQPTGVAAFLQQLKGPPRTGSQRKSDPAPDYEYARLQPAQQPQAGAWWQQIPQQWTK